MEDSTELIEAYLSNTLSEKDQVVYEQRMASDPKFTEEVHLQEWIMEGLEEIGIKAFITHVQNTEERLDQSGFFSDKNELEIIQTLDEKGSQNFEHMLAEINNDLESKSFFEEKETKKPKTTAKVFSLNTRQILSLAASVLILACCTWLVWPSPIDSGQIYADNFIAPNEQLSQEVQSELSEIGFSNQGQKELEQLSNILSHYNDKAYERFLQASLPLLSVQSLAHYQDELLFYRGISQMKINAFEDAKITLSKIESPTDDVFGYLALCAIQEGNVQEAQNILTKNIGLSTASEKWRSLLKQIQ